jgi:hypothetical protein
MQLFQRFQRWRYEKKISVKLVLIYKTMRSQNSQDDRLNKMVHKNLENSYHVSVFIYCPFLQYFIVLTVFPEVDSQQDTKKGDITTSLYISA